MSNMADKIQTLASRNKADKLIKLLKNSDKEVVLEAIDALGQCVDDDAFNTLVSLLSSPRKGNAHARRQSAGHHGQRARQGVFA